LPAAFLKQKQKARKFRKDAMKKSAIALAIALGLSAAAQADTTLYGSARVSVDYNDLKGPPDRTEGGKRSSTSNWDVVNNFSRLGVKGSEDLGEGLSAIYQFEFGVDVTDGGNFSSRQKYVGLKSDRFGTASLGTQYTPYYNVVGLNDFFNSVATFDVDIYLYPFADTREPNSFVYQTPDFGGFSLQGMAVANGEENKSGVDTWNVNGLYQNGPLTAGLAYAAFRKEEETDTHLFGLGISYQPGNWVFTFTHEQGDASLVYGKANNYLLLAAYKFGNTQLAAQYGYIDPDKGKSVDYFVVGAQQNLSARTLLWVEYIGRRDDQPVSLSGTLPVALGDQNVVSIGIRHDF
jgi:predicted porin